MPPMPLRPLLDQAALHFDSSTRLYRMQAEGEMSELMVEAWSLQEELSQPWTLQLSALGLNAWLEPAAMLNQKVTLQIVLADGSLATRSGFVLNAEQHAADAGFARYVLTIRPWIALLGFNRRSQVWQEQTLIQLIDSVFTHYDFAQWAWADGVAQHLAQSPFNGTGQQRSYTSQYRETDLGFISRLLAEEGIGYRLQEDPDAPGGNKLILFAHSPGAASCPEDPASQARPGNPGGGIRFHRASSQ